MTSSVACLPPFGLHNSPSRPFPRPHCSHTTLTVGASVFSMPQSSTSSADLSTFTDSDTPSLSRTMSSSSNITSTTSASGSIALSIDEEVVRTFHRSDKQQGSLADFGSLSPTIAAVPDESMRSCSSPPPMSFDASSSSATSSTLASPSVPSEPHFSSEDEGKSSTLRGARSTETVVGGPKTLRHARSWIEDLPSDDEDSPHFPFRRQNSQLRLRRRPLTRSTFSLRNNNTDIDADAGREDEEEEDRREWLFRADEIEAQRQAMEERRQWEEAAEVEDGVQLDDIDSDIDDAAASEIDASEIYDQDPVDPVPPPPEPVEPAPTSRRDVKRPLSVGESFFLTPRPQWVRRRPSRLALSGDEKAGSSTSHCRTPSTTTGTQPSQAILMSLSWSILVTTLTLVLSVLGNLSSFVGGYTDRVRGVTEGIRNLEEKRKAFGEWSKEWGVDFEILGDRLKGIGKEAGPPKRTHADGACGDEAEGRCASCGK